MQNKITDEYLSIAAKIFLFDGIPGNERLKNIYECSPCLRMFKSGELISSPNEYIGGLQIIVSGKAIGTAEFEENSTILRMLAKGDVFGAAALFCSEDMDYVSYIRAKGKTSVLLLDADKVERMITGSSKIAENYIKFLSGRIRYLNKRISVVTAGTAEQRLSCILLEMPRDPEGCLIVPSIAQLAKSLNLGRASVYRALQTLESSGFIKRNEDGKIIICDNAGIAEL